jgi:hypothetical protein
MTSAQQRALKAYRARLTERGLTRFEVMALTEDRDLLRAAARALADDTPDAAVLRDAMRRLLPGAVPRRGGVVEALRRAPLVGAELSLERSRDAGRPMDL